MDANGTRFHLLLGCDDWSRCTLQDKSLAEHWRGPSPDSLPLAWDSERNELTLRPQVDLLVAGKGDKQPTIADRRGVGCDRYGNWYWIDKDQRRIRVLSAGSSRASDFWPVPGQPPPRHGDFRDVETAPDEAFRFSGLTVTADHYLVVGTLDPAGLYAFDLLGGGGPMHLLWPREVAFTPFDLSACPAGGIAVLDRSQRRFWILDRRFKPIVPGLTVEPASIQESGRFRPACAAAPYGSERTGFPEGVLLDSGSPPEPLDPIALEALPDGSLLILDGGGPDRSARVLRYVGAVRTEALSTEPVKELLKVEDRPGFILQAHDFAYLAGNEKQAGRLYVVSSGGKQAFAFEVHFEHDRLALDPVAESVPLRRFGGKGLSAGQSFVHYDFGERWLPLIAERRPRFEKEAVLATPQFDSGEPGCVWHRLMLDACISSHTAVRVRSRAADEPDILPYAAWQEEPLLHLRRDGSELPWLADRVTAQTSGEDGTWELLLQGAKGRFLQIELTLQGDLRHTPRLRALRAWYPRFSYLEHYLPAVYREEEGPADFLDRFLANPEGFFTAIEDRIAAAQCLFDIRTAPADTLDWLAGWLGITLDPSWDEARRRRFFQHAMILFQYRGTVHGIRLALQLAFDDCIRAEDLAPQGGKASRVYGIRIVEQYLTRRWPGVVFGQPLAATGPRKVADQPRWTPAEGGAGLSRRYREFLKDTLSYGGPELEFPLVPPCPEKGDELEDLWRQFAQLQLGFVPRSGAQERAAWQGFLKKKYQTEACLNQAHGAANKKFDLVPLPRDWPADDVVQKDWLEFVGNRVDVAMFSARRNWQKFLARRYPAIQDLNNGGYRSRWPSFDLIPLPDRLPYDGPPLFDWYCYEAAVRPMQEKAHRFLVFLPMRGDDHDPLQRQDRLALARRIIDLEKPAHTIFEVLHYWAMFRIGEARLGLDTLLGAGSRAPELMPPFVLGRDYLGTGHITQPAPHYDDRIVLEC